MQAGAHHHPFARSAVYALYTFIRLGSEFSSGLTTRAFPRISCVLQEGLLLQATIFSDIGVARNSHSRRSSRLLERNSRERDSILILRKLKQHRVHGRVTLDNVGYTIN